MTADHPMLAMVRRAAADQPLSGTQDAARYVADPPPAPPEPGRCAPEPQQMTLAEGQRVRTAARLARRTYPGAVGELIARELHAYHDLGWLLPSGTVDRVVTEVLASNPSAASKPWLAEEAV